ncbi:MAG: cysteine desulfurase NifS [Oscillospiraceae bacterium]|jgi:cysteine desulfurase|nr:cysteine desulfurase NifS [Oscillospiraceae bacterium]
MFGKSGAPAVYMDNAATTSVKPEVTQAMLPFFSNTYGNPSSVHAFGREARKAVDAARAQVAAALGAKPEEIYFTGCGTESDNWAIKGAAARMGNRGKHIITSAIEHHAVLHTCEWLDKQGYDITYLPVDADGIVHPDALEAAIRQDTTLVSIMFANNEIGTIQPIAELASISHRHGALFHTDAVQAIGAIPVDVGELGVDLLSLSAHKFHGPKGIGALYIRKGTRLDTFMHGGAQERGQRAGTESVPSIVGLGAAIELAASNLREHSARLTAMRDRLIDGLLSRIPDVRVNGHRTQRLPGNVNISIRYVEGESLLLALDLQGIAASSGSACTSGSLDPSHVLLAIGLPHEIAHGSLRLSLGDDNTDADVDRVLDVLPAIAGQLRCLSPLYADAVRAV